jgi:hypothetical protein
MDCCSIRIVTFAIAISVPLIARGDSPRPAGSDEAAAFEKHIRPLLATKCLECHGEQKQEGNLRLDTREAMLKGGDSGPALVPGKPGESLLVEAIEYESYEMPPSGQLADASIRQFKAWITHGAVWPLHLQSLRPASKTIDDSDRDWWAFRPLVKPDVPWLPEDNWSQTPVDRFVFHQLAEHTMRPAPRADETTLVRRLYFDLIGLPPSPQQIDEFLNNLSADRWEELIDNLLADPSYGEHWGRYWLDLVRYAESDGWNQDAYRPNIWRYRDYVVKSFNADRPYPEFVRQQLAGDEMANDDPESLAATGFLRLGIFEYNQRDAKSHWNDIINEMTDVTGDVFLGIGMACARCHDHKFDPVLRTDYYKLRSFFEPVIWRDDVSYATKQQLAEYESKLQIWQAASTDIRAEIDALLKPYHDRKWKSTVDKFPLDIQACFHKPLHERSSWDQQMAYLVERQFHEEGGGPLANMSKEDKAEHERLKKELAKHDQLKPLPPPQLMTVSDFDGPISQTLMPGSSSESPLRPGFPAVLVSHSATFDSTGTAEQSSRLRRKDLAEWIARPDNPLTTRLIVNRIWQGHFGRGIVGTPNDFGHLGQPPTHPELLDWLASTFVENGWSMKQLHKLILMSATWQQSAEHAQASAYGSLDPTDDLMWRAPVRRLSAEQIRDAMLFVSGELNKTVGGPSVEGSVARRSLYVRSHRNRPNDFLHAFDAASGLKSVAERNRTTTPTQSLMMINGQFSLRRAGKLAERVEKRGYSTAGEAIRYLTRLTWNRQPTEDEMAAALEFLDSQPEQQLQAIDEEKLVDMCHVLLNSSEFLYVD